MDLRELLQQIPGIREYREKEIRREVDRRLRETVARRLEVLRRKVTDVQTALLRVPGGLRWMNDLETIQSRMMLLMDKLRTAADGYRPLLDVEAVREAELEALRTFDLDFARKATGLERHVQAVEEALTQSPEVLAQAIRSLREAVMELLAVFEQRENSIRHPAARPPESAEPM